MTTIIFGNNEVNIHFSIWKLIFSDEFAEHFSLSKLGNLCENPISSMKRCKDAANVWPNVSYITIKGKGRDLPYGCIAENIPPEQTSIYWNPDGVAISADRNVRQVCDDKLEKREGKGILILRVQPQSWKSKTVLN